MSERPSSRLTRAFKLAALQRMLAGENVSALARELGIKRKLLYQWRDRVRANGPSGLRSRGRPKRELVEPVEIGTDTPDSLSALVVSPGSIAPTQAPPIAEAAVTLMRAEARIAELERKVGQQELELDFFQKALRRVKDARSTNGAPVAPPSTRSSER